MEIQLPIKELSYAKLIQHFEFLKKGLLASFIVTFSCICFSLPLLDHCNLSSEDEWKRAHLVLSCISHAYVWCKGETEVAKVRGLIIC